MLSVTGGWQTGELAEQAVRGQEVQSSGRQRWHCVHCSIKEMSSDIWNKSSGSKETKQGLNARLSSRRTWSLSSQSARGKSVGSEFAHYCS